MESREVGLRVFDVKVILGVMKFVGITTSMIAYKNG